MSERQFAFTVDPRRAPFFERIATFAIGAMLLYLGAGILVPLVLAILLAFALAPLVNWFNRRLHLPDPVAVILSVMIAIGVLATFAYIAGTQVMKLAEALPGYQQTITTKLEGLQNQFGGGIFQQINETISNLGQQISGTDNEAQARRPGSPIPVTISNEIGPLGLLSSLLGSIIGPVATVAIVAVFLIFLLLGRSDLQDRFIRLVSAGRYSKTNIAIADASKRVARYLLIQLAVNIVYGVLFGLGLWLIGVPSAVLWGLLIILFRYIPFVGGLIIAVVPFMLAFAVDPGWNMLLLTVGLYLVIDLTTANVVEPRLYGSSTGVSAIAILLSAMFWATLWGPIGLILATPMTVCLVVIGRHLPQFQFLEMLLGSEPVLSPAERLYQRMLKGDTEDAIQLTEEYIEEQDKDHYLQDVMIPALRLANSELSDGPEALPQRRQLVQSFEAVVGEIAGIQWPEHSDILLIGGRTEIDECAAELVALALLDEAVQSRVLPPVAIRQEAIGRLDLEGVDVVALVFMGDEIRAQARYVARRIRRLAPGVRVVVCALHEQTSDETTETLHVDAIYRTIEDAAEGAAGSVRRQQRSKPPAEKARPFAGAGRGDDELGQAIGQIAEDFHMPVAVINLLDDERHAEDEEAFRLTRTVADLRDVLVVHSGTPNPAIGENAYLQTNGIDLYAAAPLLLPDGECVGALALLDYEAREFTDEDVARLKQAAADLVQRFAPAKASA